MPAIITRDLLPHICHHLLDIRALGNLSCVDQTCMEFLMNPKTGSPHWLRAGRHTCGENFWNEALFNKIVGHKDGRYTAMLHVCPWRSAPLVFPLRSLQAYEYLDSTFQLVDMKVTELAEEEEDTNYAYYDVNDAKLALMVAVRDSEHVKGGPRVVYRMGREEDAVDTLYTLEDVIDDDGDFADPYLSTTEPILRALRSDSQFVRTTERYGLGRLAEVRMVHQNMYAAIFEEGRTWRYSTILFCDFDTHRILHEHRFRDGHPRCVVFKPGEMWFGSTAGEVVYYGPNENKELFAYHQRKGDGRITRAFFETINGRARDALRLLEPIMRDLPNLSRLYIPKTELSLLDVAADPKGEAFRAGDYPELTPDAAMLLEREPRLANGVFMLKRAIRRMDTQAIAAIMKAGGPWISSDDVSDAMPYGMPYADGLDMIKPHGVKISYRY